MNRSEYTAFYNRLAQTRTQTAECIRITRSDGETFRFTAHDRVLRVTENDGVVYEYNPADAFQITALETSQGLVVSNFDLRAVISDETITEDDILGGLYNQAEVFMFLSYWTNSVAGYLPMRMSWMGELSVEGESFRADLRGIAQLLAQTFTNSTSLECRWDFCDSKCGLDADDFTITTTVTEVESNTIFAANVNASEDSLSDYEWGLVTFNDGANEGASMEIIRNYDDRMQLFLPMGGTIQPGDSITLLEGCSKSYDTCKNRFDNIRYFGGEPFLTGSDLLASYPKTPDEESTASGGGFFGNLAGATERVLGEDVT